MSKHLRIWLFVILGTLLATTFLLAQGVITMTTSRAVGEEIGLSIKANGNVTIEGLKRLLTTTPTPSPSPAKRSPSEAM